MSAIRNSALALERRNVGRDRKVGFRIKFLKSGRGSFQSRSAPSLMAEKLGIPDCRLSPGGPGKETRYLRFLE